MTDVGPSTGQPPLWTEPVVILVQPRKVAAGTDGRFFDPSERLLGSLQGTQYGQREGIEIRDGEGRPLLTVHRTGWNRPRYVVAAPDGSEWAQVVPRARTFRRSYWEVSSQVPGGWQLTARVMPKKAGRNLVATIIDSAERPLAEIEGKVSRPEFVVVDTSSAYQLSRHHTADAYLGALEISALVCADVALRAAWAKARRA